MPTAAAQRVCKVRFDPDEPMRALVRGDANHASGLDEALPGLWTTEDRRVPRSDPDQFANPKENNFRDLSRRADRTLPECGGERTESH